MRARLEGSLGLRRETTLAALPGLLSLARQVIIARFEPGDPESDALRALLDECVVGAHRIYLREQLAGGEAIPVEGDRPWMDDR